MAFTSRTFDDILAGILRDIRSLQAEADIGSDSDHYIRSAAVAAQIEGLYQKLAWLYRQIFDDTSDDDELLHKAALRGITQKAAVAATATAALTGLAGVELLAGATLKHIVSGELFVTLATVAVGNDGTAIATVQAQTAGTSLNGLTGALVLTSPPLGMDAAAAFTAATVGGTDQESVESVRARYLEELQKTPAGGTDYDYERWAKEVAGVASALCLPRRRGGGTVDVVITASDGAPSAEVIANCQAHIEDQCSVIADVWVFAAQIRSVDSTAQVELADGYNLSDVQAAADQAYAALLGALKPGEPIKRSQIEAMINNLAGVTDRILLAPAANVPAADDSNVVGWIRPGVITLELMA